MSDSEITQVDGVTYQGGHAIEQDGGSDGPAEGSDHANELEAARAAVRKAVKEAGEEGAAKAKEHKAKKEEALTKAKSDRFVEDDEDEEEAPAAKPAPAPKPKAKEKEEEAEIDPAKASVKEVLKNREKLARAKQTQSQELAQQQQYIQQMQAQVQAERQAIEREKQRLAVLRKDPIKAITEAGWDPDDLILSLAQEGTPEGKMARMIREQQQQLQAMQQWKEEQARQAQEYQQQAQVQQLVAARQSVERTFVNGALNNADRYPHLADFYKGRENALIAEGDLVAGEFRDVTGREATLEEIADYIEEQLAERANLWYQKKYGAKEAPNESRQAAAPQNTGKPARGGAKGKTLTGATVSERRALGKDLMDLDGDERLLAAREAVKVAMANSRDD